MSYREKVPNIYLFFNLYFEKFIILIAFKSEENLFVISLLEAGITTHFRKLKKAAISSQI